VTAAVLVTARFDSRRLPGKALRPVAGRPLLGRVLDRLRAGRGDERLVVATSTRAVDDPIAAFARGEGVDAWRGAADDVAGRCLACAEHLGLDRLVRICGDSPFIDPELVGRFLGRQAETGADVVTNTWPRSYPTGMSVEVIDRDALARLVAETDDPEDREHVTRWLYHHPERFRVENVRAPEALADRGVTLSVDTEDDWRRGCWIAERFSGAVGEAGLAELLDLAEAWAVGPGRSRAGHDGPAAGAPA